MIKYAVGVPSENSMYSEIALCFNRGDGVQVVFIINHPLFDSLLDESKLYIVVRTEDDDWRENKVIKISTDIPTVKELRALREKYLTTVKYI